MFVASYIAIAICVIRNNSKGSHFVSRMIFESRLIRSYFQMNNPKIAPLRSGSDPPLQIAVVSRPETVGTSGPGTRRIVCVKIGRNITALNSPAESSAKPVSGPGDPRAE